MHDAKLSTTSYAILGYLAVRPWSAYELAKQMGRTFHHFWPRAESGIYREVKRLDQHGLTRAEDERVGRRARTRYEITTSGRAALLSWLTEPRSDGFLECEGLVRVLFADQTSVDVLRSTLQAMVDDAEARSAVMQAMARDYLEGVGPFPRRLHVNLLIVRFFVDFAAMVSTWAEWADTTVTAWPDTAERDPDEATLAEVRALVAQMGPGDR